MANQQPVRFIGMLTTEKVSPLATGLGEGLIKGKEEVAIVAKIYDRARREIASGKVVVHASNRMQDLARLAETASASARSYLVKVGDVAEDKVNTTGFAKVLAAKTEAEAAAVAKQLADEIFGKNAAPVVVQPRKNLAELTVFVQLAGEATEDAVKQAFGAFGKVEKVYFPKQGNAKVQFEAKEGAAAALAKGEVSIGGGKAKVMERDPAPRERQPRAPRQPRDETKASSPSTRVLMKIKELPEDATMDVIRGLYERFGGEIQSYDNKARNCVLRFKDTAKVAEVMAAKVMTPSGKELKAEPHFAPASGKNKSSASNGTTSKSQTPAKPSVFKVLVDDAFPDKCTPEQVEKTFKDFKGFILMRQVKTDPSKYTIEYDNAEAVQSILSSKGITCGSAKVVVREGKAVQQRSTNAANGDASNNNGGRKERTPKPKKDREAPVARGVIPAPSGEVNIDQVTSAIQALDKGAVISKGNRSGDFLIDFTSPAVRDAAIGKEIKLGSISLKIGLTGSPAVKAEYGGFLPGVRRSMIKDAEEAVKAVFADAFVRSTASGAIVGVKSPNDEKKFLASTFTIKGAQIKPEALKKKENAAD